MGWRLHGLGLAALVAAAVIAGCGSSNPSRPAIAAASISSSFAASSSHPTRHVVVRTATKRSVGTYLTNASGRALYIWVKDGKGRSQCHGGCTALWPPLITKGAPKAAGGARGGDLGTTSRPDGREQVTYTGRPLYYYAGDTRPGTTRGNGSDSFGAKWWLISPSGGWVTPGH